jgi:hypothetical protein
MGHELGWLLALVHCLLCLHFLVDSWFFTADLTPRLWSACSVLLIWRFISDRPLSVKVKVTLRLTASQSVSLGIEPHLGPMTRYLFLSDSYVLISVGRPLWREDGSVFCMCRWSCQRSLPRVLVPWDLRPYFTVSDLRLPFRRLLRLTGSRWRYSTPPPHGWCSRIIALRPETGCWRTE